MALIRSRQALVSCRTQLVNHVPERSSPLVARLPKCPARSFHNKAPEHIPEALRPALGPILEQIGSLTQRIREYDRKLETICQEHYPETKLLRQVEGIGALTALTFVLTLEDPSALRRADGRGIPGAGARHRPVGRQRSSEAHLQGRRGDAEEAPGRQRSLHPWSFRLGLGSKTPRREDSLSGRQELKETGGGGRGEKTLCAAAPPMGNRRGLRPSLQHPSAPRAGGGSLRRGTMEQASTQEVKSTGKAAATLKWRMATALSPNALRI